MSKKVVDNALSDNKKGDFGEKKNPNIQSAYEIINKLYNKIKAEWKVAFISAIIIGLITHIYIITNNYPNHDAINNTFSYQNGLHLGRWFLQIACGISSYYTLPWIIGILAIIFIAITSVIIVELFNVKKKLNIILISGILVTFPSIASTFSYMYVADGYMLSLLLMTLAVLLAYKYKYGFLIGAILIALGLGIYQSYITITIMLCIFKLIFLILHKENIKTIMICFFKSLTMGILGFVLYYIILKIMLNVQNITLASYQGVDGLNNINLQTIIIGIKTSIKDFIDFPTNATQIFKTNSLIVFANIAVILISIILYIKEYIKQKLYKNCFYNILLILLIVCIPIGINIINVISTEVNYHLIMRYSWCLFYVMAIILLEKTTININKIFQWVEIISLICIIYNFIILNNIAYFKLEYRFDKSYSLATKISQKIEDFPGYNQQMPVAIIGTSVDSKLYLTKDNTSEILKGFTGIADKSILNSPRHWKNFLKDYFNITIQIPTTDEIELIKKSQEFKKMRIYPDDSSIRIIDDVLVVKLSDH